MHWRAATSEEAIAVLKCSSDVAIAHKDSSGGESGRPQEYLDSLFAN